MTGLVCVDRFTPRQAVIVGLLLEGEGRYSDGDIGRLAGLSEDGVTKYLADARARLGVADRFGLIRALGGVVAAGYGLGPDAVEKLCRRCGRVLPLESFVRQRGKRGGVGARCRGCARELVKQWKVENPETNRRIKARDRSRRDARIRGASEFELVDRFAVYEREGGRCHICKKLVGREEFELEHLWPVAAGGAHTYSNVAVAHGLCNRSKKDKVSAVQLRLG